MSDQPKGPTAEIFALSEGYILRAGERTIACTSLASLTKAVAKELNRSQVVAFPTPNVNQVRTALSPSPAPAVQPDLVTHPSAPMGGLTVEQLTNEERKHFYQIALAWAEGKLPGKPHLLHNLATYCPNLDPHHAELALAEYVADHRADDE